MLIRSLIVAVIALPGALGAMWVGFMAAQFSGDASPGRFAFFCWHVWGVVGGACFGALPGLLVGLLLRVPWVIPILGGALGAIPGLIEACGVHVLGGTKFGGYLAAVCFLTGLGIGLWIWFATAPKARNSYDGSPRELADEMERAINAGRPPRSAR